MEKKTGILNTFIRYGKLLFVFLKMSLMAQLEYRINFAAGVLVENRLVVDQAFVCGGGLPGRHQNRSPDAGSYFIVHWGVHSADRRLHAILPELYVIDDDDSGWKTRHVSGKTGCGAVSGDNAATGSVAACAGCGCGNRHDRDRLASGRTSRDGCLDRRLSLFS